MSPDLDDVSRCPRGHRCEVDGRERPDLIVATFSTPVGVLCLTTCPDHVAPDVDPAVSLSTAVRLVLQHCEHVGVTADEMAERLGEGGGQ